MTPSCSRYLGQHKHGQRCAAKWLQKQSARFSLLYSVWAACAALCQRDRWWACGRYTAAHVRTCAIVWTRAFLTRTSVFQVATVWGFAVAIGIYATADISGAHLNPAVSLALALLRPDDFRWREKLGWYWLAQILGGVAGFVCSRVAPVCALCVASHTHTPLSPLPVA